MSESQQKENRKIASFAIHISIPEKDYFKLFLIESDNRYFLENAMLDSFSKLAQKIETEIFVTTERIP